MISLLGRPVRRYFTLFVFICVFIALWREFGFWVLPPRIISSSKAYTIDGVRGLSSSYDWSRARVYHPISNLRSPPTGPPIQFPKVQAKPSSGATKDETADARKEIIKAKFVKSWEAYKAHAWKHDELKPLSAKGRYSLSGWGAQIVDALDTLWIMDLKDEFDEAVKEVALIDWSRTSDWSINVFEVTIRYLGGLLAAYDLSGQGILLTKAVELGDTLYAVFDTPNRLPSHWLNYAKAVRGKQLADERMSGAAGGSLSLEFTRLSQITGDPKYYDATERVKKFFHHWQPETKVPGLWPIMINWRDEKMEWPRFSIGAGMDSLYEYLPKMHALLGGLDPEYKDMTVVALDAVREHVLFRPMTPKDENILMAGVATARKNGATRVTADMQHLACFAGGMYGLAGKLMSREDYLDLAARLTNGCVWAYDAFPTKIMPEKAQLVPCSNGLDGPCKYRDITTVESYEGQVLPKGFVRIQDTRFMLRPEAIESVFYMWRITGDQVWRDAAWRMWEAIVKETETERAFVSIEDVTLTSSPRIDSMEVSFMATHLRTLMA